MKKEKLVKLLTKREYEVLSILWSSKDSLIASEIVKHSTDLNINTVQAVLRKLVAKEYVEIDKIVYSGTVLTRSYKPSITLEEFEDKSFFNSYQHITMNSLSASNFVASFLGSNQSTEQLLTRIQELESLIEDRKKNL